MRRSPACVEACGLTGLHLDADRRRFEFEGGPAAVALQVLDGGGVRRSTSRRRRSRRRSTCRSRARRALRSVPLLRHPRGRHVPARARPTITSSPAAIRSPFSSRTSRTVTSAPDAPLPARLERYPPPYARLFVKHAGPAGARSRIVARPCWPAGATRSARMFPTRQTATTASLTSASTQRGSRAFARRRSDGASRKTTCCSRSCCAPSCRSLRAATTRDAGPRSRSRRSSTSAPTSSRRPARSSASS